MIRNSFGILSRSNMLHCHKLMQNRGGGHGWDRPDVPLIIPYKNKRIIDIFDVNVWFYCGVSPEYFINSNEAYLGNALGGIKQAILDFRFIAGGMIVTWIIYDFLQYSRNYGLLLDSPQMFTFQNLQQVQNERPMIKNKHFLNFKTTVENGNIHYEPYTKSKFLIKYEKWISQNNAVLKENEEAKNYILRVEQQAREKVLNLNHQQ